MVDLTTVSVINHVHLMGLLALLCGKTLVLDFTSKLLTNFFHK